jgi:nicotinate-nucleotide adenylyltransferase
LATLLIVGRPGTPVPDLSILERYLDARQVEAVRRHYVEMPLIALSSTDVRQRVRHARSIRFRTPRAVQEYIVQHHLYR